MRIVRTAMWGVTLVVVPLLLVQTPDAVAQQPAAEQRVYSIPGGPLVESLNRFASEAGITLSFTPDQVDGMRAPALKGRYSVTEGLKALLTGAGLNVVPQRGGYRLERTRRGAPAPLQLTAITVTGENIERRLLDTNTSVNVHTDLEITRSNDKRISDVFARTANAVENGVGVQGFNFSIRGINSQGVGGAGSAPVVSTTIDGVPLTSVQLARGFNSLFDVEQVEILRGPQSTNQGQNSLAGAVVVSTKDPEFEQDTQAIASYGKHNTYELGLVNTGPINDEFAYRIAVQRQHSDGWIENPVLGRDDYSFSETDTVRGKLLYQPASMPLEILLSYTHVQADANNDLSTYDPANQEHVNKNPFAGRMDSEQNVVSLDVTYDFSDIWSLTSITTYNKFNSFDINSNYAISRPDFDQAWKATAEQDEFNQELRLGYSGDRWRGVVGVYYADEKNTVLRDGVAATNFMGGLDLDAEIDNPNESETRAIFAEFDFEATEKLTLTIGGRYEMVELDVSNSLLANLILPPPAPYTVVSPSIIDLTESANTDFDVFLPKLGATYALDDNQRVGFTYSEGYRQGGLDVDLVNLLVTEFDPEFVRNYEL